MLTVITGPPAAGKTTWAQAHAKPGDIVIDYDRIAQALTTDGADTHDHGGHLRRVAYKARGAALREALAICHKADVYLIHAVPDADALDRYRAYGARIITVDPGRDVVLARIREQRPAHVLRGAERWYRQRTPVQDTEQVTAQGSRRW